MKPEFSLLCSQGTATGPFSVPDESSPHPRVFFHVGVQFFIPSTPRFSSRLFNFKFLYQNPAYFCSVRATYPAHLILLDFSTLIINYKFIMQFLSVRRF